MSSIPERLSPSSVSRPQNLAFLLQRPNKWTSEHLQTLKVAQQYDVPAEDIVGTAYLPNDGDEGVPSLQFPSSSLIHCALTDSQAEFEELIYRVYQDDQRGVN